MMFASLLSPATAAFVALAPTVRSVAFTPMRDIAIDTSTPASKEPGKIEAISVVTVDPSNTNLAQQLGKHVADAKTNGDVLIVEITDNQICAPCAALDELMERPALVEAFKHVRLVKLSPMTWQQQIQDLGLCGRDGDCVMPQFYAVDGNGHATGSAFSLGEFSLDEPDAMAKTLAAKMTVFLTSLRKSK